jgi:hypothetical protein
MILSTKNNGEVATPRKIASLAAENETEMGGKISQLTPCPSKPKASQFAKTPRRFHRRYEFSNRPLLITRRWQSC